MRALISSRLPNRKMSAVGISGYSLCPVEAAKGTVGRSQWEMTGTSGQFEKKDTGKAQGWPGAK
jgi:hypothetical protein